MTHVATRRPVLHEDVRWVEQFLKAGPLVELGREELTELARRLEKLEIPPGTVLYRKDREPEGVWIICDGAVELYDGVGKNRSVVRVAGPADVVADLYLVLGIAPPLSARTARTTHALFLSAASFRHLLRTYPSLCAAWLTNFARRLTASHTRVLEVLGRSLPQRVARLLVEESIDHQIRLPQQTLAQMLGVQRTSVNRTLRAFEQQGLVELRYSDVRLRDFTALTAIAHGKAPDTGLALPREEETQEAGEASGE